MEPEFHQWCSVQPHQIELHLQCACCSGFLVIYQFNYLKLYRVANSFNQDIGSWDVSNVTNMKGMLSMDSFNQDISQWDVGNVTNMPGMFFWAYAFNQDLTQWCVSNITSIPAAFSTDSGLSASH